MSDLVPDSAPVLFPDVLERFIAGVGTGAGMVRRVECPDCPSGNLEFVRALRALGVEESAELVRRLADVVEREGCS